MSKTPYNLGRILAASLAMAALAPAALAQTETAAPAATQAGPGGYGPGMMNGWNGGAGPGPGMMGAWGGGFGPGMMRGWGSPGFGPGAGHWGGPGFSDEDRLAALKQELKITSDETDAWTSYAAAVSAADKAFASGVEPLWRNAGPGMTQDQRFDAMSQMIALQKQSYDQKKEAAAALLPKLTPFQQGQASEILPGLAAGHRGWGAGWGGGFGPGTMMPGWQD
ncbi:hypothetical protein [Acidocella sp. KAb 2-4]|uniref:hypothetical protein n=1 Tax=Acidocella sp. KAb 2-4 TaxID=2885158 RepID=UPI001D079981|nr:hypothetical protein [Acidocella sp. KAb 2-4]MCB5944200.1 hypothetical protein [Acidocella sp. KAb 2-4]